MTTTVSLTHRVKAIDWAKRTAADLDAIYLDTETTGTGFDTEIVDIGIVDHAGHVLIDSLVKPQRSIPVEASRVHGIYDDDVANAPAWPDIADHVHDVIAGRYVVIYNRDYDRGILDQVNRSCGLLLPAADWQCAMLAYADFAGEPGKYGGFRWHKLEAAARAFGIDPGGHRARADAEACRLVVRAMAGATA